MAWDPVTAGIDLVKDVGGRLISHFFPDPAQASQAILELNRLSQEGKIQEWVQNNERYRTEVEDRKSARDRESAVVTSDSAPYINKIILPILAIGVLVLSFVLFGLVVFDNDVIDSSRKDIVIYILGVLSAIDTQIIAYYFGSSSGSVQKSDFMEKLIK
jgi:hypothetical protein